MRMPVMSAYRLPFIIERPRRPGGAGAGGAMAAGAVPGGAAAGAGADGRAGAARIGWLDTARGLGIILVVIGHALGGIIDSPLGTGLDPFRRAFFAIYTFHMPLFFVLSGLLVGARIGRGARPFLSGLLATVVWPYFLWSAVQFGVICALGSLVNHPGANWLTTVLALPWKTVSQFWFLYVLFWLHVIAVTVLPRFGREGLVLLGLAAKALAVIVPLQPPLKFVLVNLLWYAIGVWLTPEGLRRLVVGQPLAVRAAVLPALAGATIGATLLAVGQYGPDLPLATAGSAQIANLAWRLPVLAAAIFGLLAVVGLASVAGRASGPLAQIGRLTMPIFVLHVLFIAGARIVLTELGLITDPAALLALLVLAGVAGPLLVERALRPLRLQRWLGF
ncbi:MAG: acyltransferase family protein [Sphingomonadales bacterium]|nr:acyltransferase family protein [Sphingomonadales bacterium]